MSYRLKSMTSKWKEFVVKMNRMGVPVPTVRDPLTGKGSITAALVVFSSGLFGICILSMLATAVAKLTNNFVLNENTAAQLKMAADYSFQFLLASLGGYLGRHLQKNSADDTTLQKEEKSRVDSPD